jgi:3-dehydroquinate dehydratase-2
MKKVLIINGPNLNLLGKRETEIYDIKSFDEIYDELKEFAEKNDIDLSYFQSNQEGKIIDKIHESIDKIDYIVINAGALTHYSYSLLDAIKASNIPTIEVHISNIFAREHWRKESVISPAVKGIISGLGTGVYMLALTYISSQ